MLKQFASAAIAASVLMSSSAVMANDFFVSGTVGKAKQTIKADGDKEKFKDTYFGFKAGKYLNDNIRLAVNVGKFKDRINESNTATRNEVITMLVVEDVDSDDITEMMIELEAADDATRMQVAQKTKVTNKELSLSLDYVDNLLSLQSTKYFVGGTFGLNHMKVGQTESITNLENNKSISGHESKSDYGFIYGAQLGLIQEFTPSISAELGYRYAKTTNKVTIDGDKIKSKAQKMPYLSVSYHF